MSSASDLPVMPARMERPWPFPAAALACRAICAIVADAIILYDAAGRPVWANPAAVTLYGCDPVTAPSVALAVRTREGRALLFAETPVGRALAGERVVADRLIIVAASGADLPVLVSAAPIIAGEEIVGAAMVWREDVSAENHAARARLQKISHRLVEVQEAERRRIARELHDEVGQALTAVKINLQAAIQHQLDAAVIAGRLHDSIAVVERALQQVRNISLDLRPSLLDDLGLVAALRWYLDNQAQRAGLTARFSATPADLRLPADVETACYRVAQEAITNVIRHAHATQIEVGLRSTGHGARLVIRDDGVGFDVAAALERASHGESLGLLGLQERAAMAGGRVDIVSVPGTGTEVRAWFPTTAG